MDIHIDINTGDTLSLVDFSAIQCDQQTIQHLISTTLHTIKDDIDLPKKPLTMSLYLVDTDEGKTLNLEYRGKDYATNVLSFDSDMADLPNEILEQLDEYSLGELIICLPVVVTEANEQQKNVQDHFTHLLVHGCLHLLGYDHELSDTVTQADAEKMEKTEIATLANLGIANPYETFI